MEPGDEGVLSLELDDTVVDACVVDSLAEA